MNIEYLEQYAAPLELLSGKDCRWVELKIMEREIDRLAYELYGLTEDEIKIVEGNDK